MGCKQPKLKPTQERQLSTTNSGTTKYMISKIFPFEHDYMKTKKKFLLHIYMRPTVNFEYNGTLNNTQL